MFKPLDTTSGAGDTGKAGGDMINTILAELYPQRRGFPRQFRYWTHGDSKSLLVANGQSDSSFFWLRKHYNHDCKMIGTSGQSGMAVTTASGQIGNDSIIAAMVAGISRTDPTKANVLVWKGLTNNSTLSVRQDMAVFTKIHNAARAAGVELTILIGLNPYSSATTATGPKYQALNLAMRQYAEANDDCWFIDSVPALVQSQTTNTLNVRTNAFKDGTHEGGFGAYFEGRAWAREYERRGVTKLPYDMALTPTDIAVRDQAETGNILRQGHLTDLTNNSGMQVANSGTGAITGTANWPGTGFADSSSGYVRLTGALNGSMSLDISRVPNQLVNAMGDRTDFTNTRLTFSGTVGTGGAAFTFATRRNMNQFDGASSTVWVSRAGVLRREIVYGLNALTGLYAVSDANGGAPPGGNDAASQTFPPLTGVYSAWDTQAKASDALGAYDTGGMQMSVYFKANTAISGSLDIYSAVARMQLEAQTPAA